MKESNNPVSRLTHQQNIELELLHSVLDDGEATYPWNPYDPMAIAYVDNLQKEGTAEALSEEEFDSKWDQVSQLAAQLWETPSDSLLVALAQKFGTRMPANLLKQLAGTAQAVSQNGCALIDQLIDVTQAVLDSWETDDLKVMARPLAMAMRGGEDEILEITLRSIRSIDWEDLSEIEQARLSLVAARYALGEISEEA